MAKRKRKKRMTDDRAARFRRLLAVIMDALKEIEKLTKK